MSCRHATLIVSHIYLYYCTGNLDLGVNAIRGAIPTEVAGLPNLEQLRLRENRLTGVVPEELLLSGNVGTFVNDSVCKILIYFPHHNLMLHAFCDIVCFDASLNSLMENYIPQGQCPQGAAEMAVACEDESDQACLCCVCWRTGTVEYCKQLLL